MPDSPRIGWWLRPSLLHIGRDTGSAPQPACELDGVGGDAPDQSRVLPHGHGGSPADPVRPDATSSGGEWHRSHLPPRDGGLVALASDRHRPERPEELVGDGHERLLGLEAVRPLTVGEFEVSGAELGLVADDLVLEQLESIRQDLQGLATKPDLVSAVAPLSTRAELEALRGELVASRDRLAARVSQLERDVQELERSAD